MSKALIIYFSQGNTTKDVAKKIAKGIKSKQFHVDLYNISDGKPPDICDYDMIGVGSPVYIQRPPFNVQDYIEGLPGLNGLPFFVFLLYGTYPGSAGNILRNRLSQKGGKEIGFAKFKGADLFLGYLQRGVLFSPNSPTENEMEKAVNFGRDMVSNFSKNLSVKPGMDTTPGVVYAIEKFITAKFIVNHLYTYFFKADMEKCNSCKICVQTCPNQNITLDEDDIPKWGHNCIACFYCEMKCPKDAIKSPLD